MKTRKELTDRIMAYWNECIQDFDKDYEVNSLICEYADSVGILQERLDGDVYLTVENMTNTQKRELLSILLESGINEIGAHDPAAEQQIL